MAQLILNTGEIKEVPYSKAVAVEEALNGFGKVTTQEQMAFLNTVAAVKFDDEKPTPLNGAKPLTIKSERQKAIDKVLASNEPGRVKARKVAAIIKREVIRREKSKEAKKHKSE